MAPRTFSLGVFLLAAFVATSIPLDGQNATERVLIRGSKPYTHQEAAVIQAGGSVSHRFTKIDAIAAEVPASALRQLRSQLPAGAVSKDEVIAAPGGARDLEGRPLQFDDAEPAIDDAVALGAETIAELAENNPAAYTVNNGITRVNALHAAGFAGQLEFQLHWQEDWSRYPTTDLDLLLVNPANAMVTSGATANSPERVTIDDPAPGNWTIIVDASRSTCRRPTTA